MIRNAPKKVFLYAGLPKTGSAFLRQEVFTKLTESLVCVNPEGVTSALQEMHVAQYSPTCKNRVKKMVMEALTEITQDTVLITDLSLAGGACDNLSQMPEITDFLADLFPDASVIITLRNQVDWLLSLYKHETTGRDIPITKFLNYRDGAFGAAKKQNYPNVDALGFDFVKICEYYVKIFGKENVHILFYEDMAENQEDFVCQVGEIFDCDITGDVNFRMENRSFSAFSMQLTLWKEKFRTLLIWNKNRRLGEGWLVRIIQWLGSYDLGGELWRDAIKKKGVRYAFAIALRRVLLRLRWDYFIRNVLDRIIYLDWDLLGKERRKILSQHYSRLNGGLVPYLKNSLAKQYYVSVSKE
tara:strand:- start:81 stop:1148 length:1068 start_codon:yes stop_codon:yes gene_type:complete